MRREWDFPSETGRVITSRGIKPVATVQWQRDNYWIYGVVEPLSGWHFTAEYERLDSKQFQAFLDALSIQLGEDVALIQFSLPRHIKRCHYTGMRT